MEMVLSSVGDVILDFEQERIKYTWKTQWNY